MRWRTREGVQLQAKVGDFSELRVLHELFVLDEYRLPQVSPPRTIVDLGSNAGMSVLYFHALYPRARILAVEPQAAAARRLEENVAHIGQVSVARVAVSDRDGVATLYSGDGSWAASLNTNIGRGQEVETATLDRLCRDHGFSTAELVKMDVEGAEVPVFHSAPAILGSTKTLIFEFHQEHATTSVWELLRHLDAFTPLRLTGDSDVHPLVLLERTADQQRA